MSRYVPEALAKEVIERAGYRCEYCLILIEDTFFGGEIDHIRSLKHNGKTESENLSLACHPCNRKKGTDLGSIHDASGQLVRFFNPRTDLWTEHFQVNNHATIEPLTAIGEVTARIFGFNETERILERQGLIELVRYPLVGEK